MRRLVPLTLWACGPGDPCGSPGLEAAWICGADLPLTVLEVRPESERPVVDGSTLSLVRGTQGLQHIELRLEASFPPEASSVGRARVQVELHRDQGDVAEGSPPAVALDLGLPLTPVAGPGASVASAGPFLVVVEAPEELLERPLWLLSSVSPVGSQLRAASATSVFVQWAAD